MKTARDYIKEITIHPANLEYIAKNGSINGSLLIDLEQAFKAYAQQQITSIDNKVHSICVEHEVNPSVMTLISNAILETHLVV